MMPVAKRLREQMPDITAFARRHMSCGLCCAASCRAAATGSALGCAAPARNGGLRFETTQHDGADTAGLHSDASGGFATALAIFRQLLTCGVLEVNQVVVKVGPRDLRHTQTLPRAPTV